MKVVYSIFLLSITVSCASSVYRISHKHLERNDNIVSLGIWVHPDWWVEMIDDPETTYPFDESVWKSVDTGTVDYIDCVREKGSVHRFYWHLTEKKFKFLTVLEVNAFQYYYIIREERRTPI